MSGPQENRFRTALTGAEDSVVRSGATDWRSVSQLLENVSRSLDKSATAGNAIGGQTGPALAEKFRRASRRILDRSRDLDRGNGALVNASESIAQARNALQQMEQQHNAPEPGVPPKPAPKNAEPGEIKEASKQQDAYNSSVNAYAADQAARERISKQWADTMDRAFNDSTETMKEIHGFEPQDPDGSGQPAPGRSGPGLPVRGPLHGDTDGAGTGGSGGHDDQDDGADHPHDGDSAPDDHTDGHDGHGDGDGSGGPGSGHGGDHGNHAGGHHDSGGDGLDLVGSDVLTSGGHGGGPGLGTVGGLAVTGAGGGALAAGIRGLVVPSSVSSAGVRPIGSTSHSAVSGALGRGGVTPGTPVTRTGGAAGSGRGTGAGRSGVGGAGRGTPGVGQAGSRGGRATGGRATGGRTGAGRAAAGGVGTGRGRAGRDEDEEQRRRRDLFDDGSDWIDDEGAAPDVLH